MRKNTRFHHIDLMLKFLEGNSSKEEKDRLDAWLLEDQAHAELFRKIRLNWHSAPRHTSRSLQAYETLSKRLGFPDTRALRETREKRRIRPGRLLRWAAVFAGFLVLALSGYYFYSRTPGVSYHTGYAEIRTFLLPDSSTVTLNANSTLTLPENWADLTNRRVKLDGEAFFEVKRKRRAPSSGGAFKKFIVSTNNLEVEVLGTTFNVNSRNMGTRVALNSGSIRLKLRDIDREILMQPGDFVEVASSEEPVIRKGVDVRSYSTWKDGRLSFDGITIKELQTLLRDNYGLTIRFEAPELTRDVRLRGTFPSASPELLLKAIADVTQTQPVKEDGGVYYKQKDKLK